MNDFKERENAMWGNSSVMPGSGKAEAGVQRGLEAVYELGLKPSFVSS